MGVAWGIVVVVFGLVGWGGQTLSLFAPETAARWGLTERADAVEPAYHADIRGEALTDFLTLWTFPTAGALLIAGVEAWAHFGLVGGAMFVYFGVRGVLTRLQMQRRGLRIGTAENVKTAYVALPLWGLAGLVTIIAAIAALT